MILHVNKLYIYSVSHSLKTPKKGISAMRQSMSKGHTLAQTLTKGQIIWLWPGRHEAGPEKLGHVMSPSWGIWEMYAMIREM